MISLIYSLSRVCSSASIDHQSAWGFRNFRSMATSTAKPQQPEFPEHSIRVCLSGHGVVFRHEMWLTAGSETSETDIKYK